MRAIGCLMVLFATGCAHLPTTPAVRGPLRPGRDTFAFANETVFAYRDGIQVSNAEAGRDSHARRYTRNCFVMSRAVIQFWKFARFDPAAAPVTDEELARRIRAVAHRAPWAAPWPEQKRIVFPGFADLYELSQSWTRLVQEHLGSGLATYFRPGNAAMPFVPSRNHQAAVQAQLDAWLAQGYPVALWLCNFPSLSINHVVVAYDHTAGPDQRTIYNVYDPNYDAKAFALTYDPATRTFSYEPTFYFVGGRVAVRPIYRNFFQ